MLDLKDLRCFVSVYERKGFARAAAELGTVQSNISARVRRLEVEIGAPLFERLHRSIRPTPARAHGEGPDPARKCTASTRR